MKTVLKNCRVLGTTHDKDMLHDIYVENGIIEKIGLNLEVEGAKQIDVGGHTVMSGLIDMHCNICDPGHEYIEDIATASRAALRGGFTTITCEPNTDPVIDNKTVVEYIVSKSHCSICGKSMQSLSCPHRKGKLYWGDFAIEMIDEIKELQAVCLVSHPEDKRCIIELQEDRDISEKEKF